MSGVRLRLPAAMRAVGEALERDGVTDAGLVFAADPDPPEDFPAVEAELLECFRASREAAAEGRPIVYVISQADLLGQRGPLGGLRAGALLSALRSLAFEGARDGLRANALAVGDTPDPERVATWIAHLLLDDGVSGELVRVDAAHVGKALP
ncbi:MAG: hypothetical protein ACRDPC_07565 [Solirubrobacteraceae bacterium]